MANDRGKNLNAFLALLHKPAQLVPSADTGNAGGGWALPCDGKNVAKAVIVKPGHRSEIRGQGFALAFLKLLDQIVNGLLDELLCGVVALAGALLIRRVVRVRCAAFFLCGAALLAVPLLAVVAAMLVVPLLNSMMCSSGSHEGPIGVQKQEHPNQISFVECPRFMALSTGGGGRFRQGRALGARSSKRMRRPLTGSSASAKPVA